MGLTTVGVAPLQRSLIFDLIPIVSTFSNLAELFLKYVVLSFKSAEAIKGNYYFTHLKEKSLCRCLLLLIPGVGNFVILILNGREKRALIAEIERDFDPDRSLKLFQTLPGKFAIDEEILDVLIFRDRHGLMYPKSRFAQQNRTVTTTAIRLRGTNFIHADPSFQKEREMIFAALEDWPPAAAHLPPEQAEAALAQNPLCFPYFLHLYQNVDEFLRIYEKLPAHWQEFLEEQCPTLASQFQAQSQEPTDRR